MKNRVTMYQKKDIKTGLKRGKKQTKLVKKIYTFYNENYGWRRLFLGVSTALDEPQRSRFRCLLTASNVSKNVALMGTKCPYKRPTIAFVRRRFKGKSLVILNRKFSYN